MAEPTKRPKRTPLGARNILTYEGKQDPGFVYRFINDKEGRLKRAQEAGYEFVMGDEKIGDKRVAEGTAIDSRISKPVGNGTTGFLMRIPKEYYQEDQDAKQASVDATEEAMKPEQSNIKKAYGPGLTND